MIFSCTYNSLFTLMLRRSLLIAALFMCVLFSACKDSRTESTDPQSGNYVVIRNAQEDQVQLTVRLDRSEAVVGDPIKLVIDVTAPDGFDVEMPSWEDAIGPFSIDDRYTPLDVPEGNLRRWVHRYTLSTFESGELDFPEVEVKFTASGVDGISQADETASCATEPIPLKIHSVLGSGAGPEAHRDIRGAVDVPLKRSWLWLWWSLGIVCVLVIVAVFFLYRHRSIDTSEIQPELPPHIWAQQELDRLFADDLFAQSRIQEFYFRLSDIVRRYIERQFGLMAPERTTDEFLREANQHDQLAKFHQELLSDFLRAADMVKFALYRPASEEGNAAGEAARTFILETAPVPSNTQDAESPDRQEITA